MVILKTDLRQKLAGVRCTYVLPVAAPSNACLYRMICCEHTQLPAVEEVGVYEIRIISNVIVIAVQSVRSTRVQLWEHDDSCQPVRSTEASGANR